MKRTILLAAVLALVLSAAAFAEGEQDFGIFKAYVPEGWTATKNDETVIFTKNDNTSSASITVANTDGTSLKDLADAFVAEFKKSFKDVTAPQVDEDGDYMFEMTNANDVKSVVLLTGTDKEYALIVLTGVDAGGEGLGQILGTMQESFKNK
ncbi:MAG: hypothetical protein IJG51_12240 [Synergistaceae bacterium]|nr:hypothetical protein [Synergistaceae bacterium]MBQ3345995.1 hypothetical protein [Synergistaceae bacterium]MBQ3399651.1 hypothetical protein [Synergistaceae bacterium]MBQ3758388.1 hypothetical protein [Synergistaceae bacterium]MBQ4401508.1 hypothetical protein [Synergistaceae bacterium]